MVLIDLFVTICGHCELSGHLDRKGDATKKAYVDL